MEYNYNGTIINLKDKTCRLWDNPSEDIYPQANLYIRIGNKCNANCRFCEYHGKQSKFDYDKFDAVLRDLSKRKIIGKIQITGGEPTLDSKRLKRVVYQIRQYFPNIFIGINSNGSNLSLLKYLLTSPDNSYRINNAAISRHHYDDKLNREIFNVSVMSDIPSEIELKLFILQVKAELDKLNKDSHDEESLDNNFDISDAVHFSCNLISGYICDIESVKKYIKWASNIGVEDFGFVTLMPINNFASSHRIDFGTLGFENNPEFLNYKQYKKEIDNKICCKCANYLYYNAMSNKILDLYGRYVVEYKDTTGQLVFDGENLKTGFNGGIITI